MTEIQHNETDKKFEIFQDGKSAGFMTYTWAGDDKFIIDHTEVGEQYGGLGLGKKLVEAGVNFAKEKGVKIIPLCPFAKAAIQKNSDWQDLV